MTFLHHNQRLELYLIFVKINRFIVRHLLERRKFSIMMTDKKISKYHQSWPIDAVRKAGA